MELKKRIFIVKMIKQKEFKETGRTRYFYLNLDVNGKEIEISLSYHFDMVLEINNLDNWDILGEHNLSSKEIGEIEEYLDELDLNEAIY